ncbi:MAG: hypothetical protein IPK33_00350 [Gemmatimonadetes bacterium]|nr:hypothetical protein [Gemmatimonadota bacterium]
MGLVSDSLQTIVDAPIDSSAGKAYLVVSIADRRLWYRDGDSLLFDPCRHQGAERSLAKGGGTSGSSRRHAGGSSSWTRRAIPAWVPSWHYVEVAHKKKLRLVDLKRTDEIPLPWNVLMITGSNVVKRDRPAPRRSRKPVRRT